MKKIRSVYDPPARVTYIPVGPSMTEQQFAQDADINHILDRYRRTGYLPPARKDAMYLDVTAFTSFRDALESLSKASAEFEKIPSRIRTLFANDPGKYLAYVTNPANTPEAIRLGILSPAVPAEPLASAPQAQPAPEPPVAPPS